jgi:hypothetical protein
LFSKSTVSTPRICSMIRCLVIVLVSVLAGCADDPEPVVSSDTGGNDEPDAGVGPDALELFFDELLAHADHFLFEDGEWLEDYGDAPFYGVGLYARIGMENDDSESLALAAAAYTYNLSIIQRANISMAWLLENLEEVFMAMLGVIEYAGIVGDTSGVAELDRLLDTADALVQSFDDYLNVSVGNFAADTYGPTSITAGFALVYLQYATFLDNDLRETRIERAAELVAAIDSNAAEGDHYLFGPGDDRLYLYPNSMMINVLNRLYEQTGTPGYLDRAEEVLGGIQALRDDQGYYRSPYSAVYMGAETEDYSTLSSQNYLVLAHLLLYQNTQNEAYLEGARSILTFLSESLYDADQGKVLHHWIDGHIAQADDPEYFCSGCNLQLLYVIWYLFHEVAE